MKRLLFLFLWLFCVAVAATPLRLELEVSRQTSVEGKPEPAQREKVTAILAPDYLEIRRGQDRLVHDFAALRSYRVTDKEVVNRSLFADLGFRVAEMRNRLGLQHAMKEAKVSSELLGDAVLAEHLFSVDDEVSESGLAATGSAPRVYKHGDKLLAEVSSRGEQLEPEAMRAYLRFLRYYCGGHPDILADLQTDGRVPAELRLDFYNVNEVVSYRIRALSTHPHTQSRPVFDAPITPPPEPLTALAKAALKLSPETVAQTAIKGREASLQALNQGDVQGAVLRLFEAMLMDGGDVTPELSQMRSQVASNADSAALIEALTLGEADPVGGEAALVPVEAKAGPGAHVVAILRAGLLLASDRHVESRDLYLQALAANPAVTGAWKDLGDIYHTNYETDIAWACWDVGRHLAPNHPMLAQVQKLEEYLRSNYPGFF